MAVPTWTRILDSEIDPESPITTSLMFRLRDNICAVLGIDPASVTAPLVTFGPSQIRYAAKLFFACVAASSSYATSSENIVVDLTAAFEKGDTESMGLDREVTVATSGVDTVNCPVSLHDMVADHHDDPTTTLPDTSRWKFAAPYVAYAAGVPDSLKIPFIRTNAGDGTYSGNMDTSSGVITLPLDNSYHDELENSSSGSVVLQMKARATSTAIYLQMRSRYRVEIDFYLIRNEYEAKA